MEVSQVCLKLDCSHQQNILPSFSTRNISASSKFDRLGLGWVQQSSYRGALECPERLLLHSLLKEILVQINLLYRSNRNLTINFQNCSIHRKSCAAQKICFTEKLEHAEISCWEQNHLENRGFRYLFLVFSLLETVIDGLVQN